MSTAKTVFPAQCGSPLPLGITAMSEGINFSLFSRHARQVTLVIDFAATASESPARKEFWLDPRKNRTGDIWHILLDISANEFTYGYRLQGPVDREDSGLIYNPHDVLIDPFCTNLVPRKWGETSLYGAAPSCRLIRHDFDWQGDRPLMTPLPETLIYELHLRGFTRHPSADVRYPGTYLGLIDKIPYLKNLGITAVELMPVTEFDENDIAFPIPEGNEPLKNFWGYNPVSFFALKSGYAADWQDHINEFKTMILALHQAGIEVILDIVFNHSGEGGYEGTTSSFRGIDNSIYYLLGPERHEYLNFSGCGNTLNCNHPVVRDLIRDALRFWVVEMHIDGFRFDLASILGRDRSGQVLSNPPMIEMIAEDPVLRDTKIIAEAWDAAGLYQVGSFSTGTRWAEWNGRFRDDLRAFMAGYNDTVTKIATRIAGSSDLYQTSCRSPLSSINFITSHDGFTLYDLVSYNEKHNRANGEDNRDGDNNNISWNSGHEGSPCPREVLTLRFRRMRSMAAILLFSQGIPMITAGDEFGRSQGGNNNAWSQDNQTSWLDWSLAASNSDLLRFFQLCILLRKDHPVFRREDFFLHQDSTAPASLQPEITWQYLQPGQQDWSPECHGLSFLLHGVQLGIRRDDDFFIMLNGNREESLRFLPPIVPDAGEKRAWFQIIDTAAASPHDVVPITEAREISAGQPISVLPQAMIVLQSKKRSALQKSSSISIR